MLAADPEEAIRIGREALAMAEALGLEEVRAATLNNIGSARGMTGDPDGIDDLAEAIRVAEAANAAWELGRAKGNLANLYWQRGRLREGLALWEDALEDCRRFGQREFERWVRGILVDDYFAFGRWDDGVRLADDLIDDVESGRPHYLLFQAYSARALVRLARDAGHEARADAEHGIAAARRAQDSQAVFVALARAAYVLLELGSRVTRPPRRPSRCSRSRRRGHPGFSASSMFELSWSAPVLGLGERLANVAARLPGLWAEAATAAAAGAIRSQQPTSRPGWVRCPTRHSPGSPPPGSSQTRNSSSRRSPSSARSAPPASCARQSRFSPLRPDSVRGRAPCEIRPPGPGTPGCRRCTPA